MGTTARECYSANGETKDQFMHRCEGQEQNETADTRISQSLGSTVTVGYSSCSDSNNLDSKYRNHQPNNIISGDIKPNKIDRAQAVDKITVIEPTRAIIVRNAWKSFGSEQPVLNDFNMTVDSGTIYSLLGSSGCGKTTLLSCCVGLRKLDRGEIQVLGYAPGSRRSPGSKVGYMPQELSLYNEFSIAESLRYFGRLHGMTDDKIQLSTNFLLELLELPDSSRRVHTLSGGQKRRVSFSLALVHSPMILILDEPTVGVDPLLRESIWNYLNQLVSTNKTTVIITTHYIEEASQSSTVGVMRNGRLLVEKAPHLLMLEYGVPRLEQIVLNLCRNDNKSPPCIMSHKITMNGEDIDEKRHASRSVVVLNYRRCSTSIVEEHSHKISILKQEASYTETVQKDFWAMLYRLKALTYKNFIILLRNVWFLLFIFVVPATQIILICLAIGPDPKHLAFGVINNEVTNSSQPICESMPGCAIMLSCKYLDMLPKESIHLKRYKDEEAALNDIQLGKIWGFLSFPSNYSAYLVDRAASGIFADNETFDGSRVTVEMDMSNQQIAHTIKRMFFEVYQQFITIVSLDCSINPRQAELPVYFKPPIYGSDGTSFSEFLAPSVFLGLLFFFPLCSSGISHITEKKSGTLDRSLVCGVTTSEIMIAHLISQLVVLIGQSCLAFLFLNIVFRIPILGSIPLALFLATLIGLSGMSMGFLISTICHEEIHAVLLAIGSFFPNFILAGMVWPIQGMPLLLQYIAYLLPCTLACESMRSIVSRGWELTHSGVWPGISTSVGWILVYWTLTILLHHIRNKK